MPAAPPAAPPAAVPPSLAQEPEPVVEEWAPPAPPELEMGPASGGGQDAGVEELVSESFADVTPPMPEPQPAPLSEAASLSVPVEMVEKIAQRVVAQISEKAVREIAWEVIPELAEALIKQEIERLKAELQKT
jgi:uncharacterized small protein (DUF1192 family)